MPVLNHTDSDDTEFYNTSDSTELYELDEIIIGTIKLQDLKLDTVKTETAFSPTDCLERNIQHSGQMTQKTQGKLFTFKCPTTSCSVRSNTRKGLHQHYMSSHRHPNNCHLCDKKYRTPQSLKQHLYSHLMTKMDHKCKKCGKVFPFYSQLKIHQPSHSKKPRFECDECYQPYKFRQNMLKHSSNSDVQYL